MMYNCNICKYGTNNLTNYDRHKKTIKHIVNEKNQNDNIEFGQEFENNRPLTINRDVKVICDDNICDDCGMKFKYLANMYRHQRTSCSKQNLKIKTNDNFTDSKTKKLEEELIMLKLKNKDNEIKYLQEYKKETQKEMRQLKNMIQKLNENQIKTVNNAGNLAVQTLKNSGND